MSYMWDNCALHARRQNSRIAVESLCSEIAADAERFALVTDLSEDGLRLEQPPGGARPGGILQLEFEIPGYDEMIWASGQVCFDRLWQKDQRIVRTTGIRFMRAAGRHLRALREFVVENRRALDRYRQEDPWWARATGLSRG